MKREDFIIFYCPSDDKNHHYYVFFFKPNDKRNGYYLCNENGIVSLKPFATNGWYESQGEAEKTIEKFLNMKTYTAEEAREVFAVYTNTDLTEGRGNEYCAFLTTCEATAIRLAKGINVQGTDGSVRKVKIFRIKETGTLVGPLGPWYEPTREDLVREKELERMRAERRSRAELIQRIEWGELTDEDKDKLKQLLETCNNE